MEPYGLGAGRLAMALGIPQNCISDIVRGRRGIAAAPALRLERAVGASGWFWLSLLPPLRAEFAERDKGSVIRNSVKRLARAA